MYRKAGFTRPNGAWRSLVAHLLWEQGVASSNLAAPTKHRNKDQALTKHGVSCCQLSPGKFLSDPTSPGGAEGRPELARRTNAFAAALAFRRFSPTQRNEILTRSHDCASFAVLTPYRVLRFEYFLIGIPQKRRGGLIMLGLLAR